MVLFALPVFLWAPPVYGQARFEGLVYRKGSNRSELLFKKYNEIVSAGDETSFRHLYTLPDGTPAASEEVVRKNGAFKSYSIAFHQVLSFGTVERRGETIVFTHRTTDGITSSGEAPYKDDIMCGPCLEYFVSDNWQSILAGGAVKFSLPVVELKRTVNFRFKRVGKSPYAREGAVVVRMEPVSPLVDLLLKPVDFVYNEDTRLVEEIHGPTVLKTYRDGRWVNTEVDIYYKYL
jgi:hypothetical protein